MADAPTPLRNALYIPASAMLADDVEVRTAFPISAKALSAAIGGYFEVIRLDDGAAEMLSRYFDDVDLGDPVLLVDEDGLLKGLPHNLFASVVARQPIVGDALIVDIRTPDEGGAP